MMHDHHREDGRLGRLRVLLLPNCREMTRLSSRSLDAPLPLLQQLGAAVHLIVCRLCRRYRDQVKWLRRTALKSADSDVHAELDPPRLPEETRTRLKQSLRKHTAAAGDPEGRPTPGTAGAEPDHDHRR